MRCFVVRFRGVVVKNICVDQEYYGDYDLVSMFFDQRVVRDESVSDDLDVEKDYEVVEEEVEIEGDSRVFFCCVCNEGGGGSIQVECDSKSIVVIELMIEESYNYGVDVVYQEQRLVVGQIGM